ncbi:hypothetical protein B0I08_1135 [Glaciihabitans tibetensis]|uniref:Uncharacterized protein n=1 Tax=Glaciihabitans tibetensis TaxID=1266600 RepID=A0A2T0V2L1_9MICO|nr:hypothetical protein B0I08_1135 [Glaciihabitans tibetensis]
MQLAGDCELLDSIVGQLDLEPFRSEKFQLAEYLALRDGGNEKREDRFAAAQERHNIVAIRDVCQRGIGNSVVVVVVVVVSVVVSVNIGTSIHRCRGSVQVGRAWVGVSVTCVGRNRVDPEQRAHEGRKPVDDFDALHAHRLWRTVDQHGATSGACNTRYTSSARYTSNTRCASSTGRATEQRAALKSEQGDGVQIENPREAFPGGVFVGHAKQN